ncbi:MAG TPA: MFS transporter, partial [Nitrospirota bacterium]|nr:MFS transporter [Nitrospirota bacterium]
MSEPKPSRISVHYAWIIVFTGTLCIIACLGFGRFAFGMLLPSMASSLNLSYAQMGYISTCNFIGYLAAVLFCGRIAGRIGSQRLIVAALILISASMALISRSSGFLAILILYMITGIGSGAVNVPVMGLITSWFDRTIRGRAAGFVVIGSGFAIIISGKLIPFINKLVGPEGWRISWLILSGTIAAIALIGHLFLSNKPQDKGLIPLGSEGKAITPVLRNAVDSKSIYVNKTIYLLGAIYFLFGFTYVIYATFIVTTMVRERGFSEAVAGNFWSWVGFLS